MAKKKVVEKSKRSKRSFGSKLKWVQNHISEEKLKYVDDHAPKPETIMEVLLGCVDWGIDVKVSWDDYSECYQVTAIGAWEGFPSAGYACSARSSRDVYDALCLLWFKVVVSADGDLSSLLTDKDEDDIRG